MWVHTKMRSLPLLTALLCLVGLYLPRGGTEVEVQEVLTQEVWIPQHGAMASAYFDRFDTQEGKRTLLAVEFKVSTAIRFYHGIEVLDDAPYRWNVFGASPGDSCDCNEVADCDGLPGGTWVKGRLLLNIGDQPTMVLNADTRYFGLSVMGAPGPFDGTLDQDGPSGNYRWQGRRGAFITPRYADPEILAEFTGAGFESMHMEWNYGAIGRLDCPESGAESFNVDSSYDHFAKALIRLTYHYQ